MSMGGKGPEVLVTLTTDFGKVLDGLHRTKIRGSTHLATGIQIAGVGHSVNDLLGLTLMCFLFQLALKHRQNKSQRQRIIVFTCSPIDDDEKSLNKLALRMKKLSISIDFIVFGDLDPENTHKLELFNETVKGPEGSHMAIIPPGPSLLSDHIITTPILSEDGVGPRGGENGGDSGADAGGGGFEFGVDPSTDPELALALRMSMEEEKARQEKETAREIASKESNLEGIPEEGGEAQPLLNESGEASGSGHEPTANTVAPDEEKDKDKDKDKDDGDRMDTA